MKKMVVLCLTVSLLMSNLFGCAGSVTDMDTAMLSESASTSLEGLIATSEVDGSEAFEAEENESSVNNPIAILAPEYFVAEIGERIKIASAYSLDVKCESEAGRIIALYISSVTFGGVTADYINKMYLDCPQKGEGFLVLTAVDEAGNRAFAEVKFSVVGVGERERTWENYEPEPETEPTEEETTAAETKSSERETKPVTTKPANRETDAPQTTAGGVTTTPEETTPEETTEESNIITGIPLKRQLGVGTIYQNPELPTGCESVALTIVLNYFGYHLDKTTIARDYLVKHSWNYAIGFVGDPFKSNGGGVFAPGLISTANAFLSAQGAGGRGRELTGTAFESLYRYVAQGVPVIIWVTSGYSTNPGFTGNKVSYNGHTYRWYRGEHCVVLCGYDQEKGTVTICDPQKGRVTKDAELVKSIYDMTGCNAMILTGVTTPEPLPEETTPEETTMVDTQPSETETEETTEISPEVIPTESEEEETTSEETSAEETTKVEITTEAETTTVEETTATETE